MNELLGYVQSLHRYPVKSLAGQSLEVAEIALDGIPGDRESALIVTAGHARAGKTYRGKEHNWLHTTHDPQAAAAMAAAGGVATELRSGERFFDAAPISLLFDHWVDEVSTALGKPLDFQRWRPNIFARAMGDFVEDDLIGKSIQAGSAVLHVRCNDKRCVATTYDRETGESDPRVLSYVAQNRANVLGVYCDVELAGTVRVGDPLRLRAR